MPSGALKIPSGGADFLARFDAGSASERSFLSGPENLVLLRACEELSAAPSCLYNPLVLHGPAGYGKTLLARAVAARFAEQRAGAAVLYLTGADFATEYAQAVESRNVPAWRRATREVALLVIDDLSPLAAKRPAQVELLHTIDEVLHRSGQVLVTAPKPVGAIAGLLPALVGRLAAGLTMGIAPVGRAARQEVLREAAAERQIAIEADAAALLASELPLAVPELFGTLYELHAAAGSQAIDRRQVERYLGRRKAPRSPSLREIAACAARHHGLEIADLRGPSRRQNVVAARCAAMFLARQITGKSFGAVGQFFGGRDHTTVLHACRKTEQVIAVDVGLRRSVTEIRTMLEEK